MTFPAALDPVRSLTAAFRLVGRNPLPLLFGGVILLLFDRGHGLGIVGDWDSHHFQDELPGRIFFGGCCGLFGLLVWSWIGVGFAHVVEETRRSGTSAFATLFDARGRFGDMLLALFLHLLAWLAAGLPILLLFVGASVLGRHTDIPDGIVVLAAIAGLFVYLPFVAYVLLGLVFVPQEVALGARPAIESFRASWELARGRRLAIFVFCLALAVFTFVGFCCFCVGVLFTGAVANVATFEAWLELSRPMVASPSAPPPQAYPATPPLAHEAQAPQPPMPPSPQV
ncbi:MAG: hypothetical protein IPJ77_11525 [Planctomycetes bacterium]|nr:hypothetical protein [Planctomycetota bacterium]